MDKIKRVLSKISTFYEVHFSAILLITMIALFCAQIFIRYVINGDTFYVFELSVIAFGWTSIIGASYGFRRDGKYGDGHVRFTVLYDLFSKRGQALLQIIISLIIIASFIIMMPATWKTICQYHINKTTILKMPFSIIYFPFLIFMIITIIHCMKNLVDDIKAFRSLVAENGKGDKAQAE